MTEHERESCIKGVMVYSFTPEIIDEPCLALTEGTFGQKVALLNCHLT